jgi:hypothetical protein
MAGEAATVVQLRNKFAHGPLEMGINFDTRKFEVFLRNVGVRTKELTFESTPLSVSELRDAHTKVSDLYQKLMRNWAQIVGVSRIDPTLWAAQCIDVFFAPCICNDAGGIFHGRAAQRATGWSHFLLHD